MKLLSTSFKSPSLRAARGEAIQVRRERANTQVRPYNFQIFKSSNFQIIFFLLLLTTSTLHSQTITWGDGSNASFAEDINVGSSENSYIEFYFSVSGGDISNAKVEVILPFSEESFNTSGIQDLGTASLGSPVVNSTKLTFGNVAGLTVSNGKVIHYRVPRYSRTQYNSIRTTGTVTVNVFKNTSSSMGSVGLGYNYKYAQLRFVEPDSYAAGSNQTAGYEMNFGNNNGGNLDAPSAQTFGFKLECIGGAVDSALVSLTFPVYAAVLNNWTVAGVGIPDSRVTMTATSSLPISTTYTLRISNSDIPGGKGLKTGDGLHVTFDAVKNTCGVTTVAFLSSWAVQNNVKTSTDQSKNGSFNANTVLAPPSLKNISAFLNTAGMLCQDGSSNMATFYYTNTGSGKAKNIRIEHYWSPDNNGVTDTAFISARIGINGVREKARNLIAYSTTTSPAPAYNPVYRPLQKRWYIDVAQTLDPGDTLYVEIPFSMPSDLYLYQQGVENMFLRYTYIAMAVRTYTDACGEIQAGLGSQTLNPSGATSLNGFVSYDNSLILKGGGSSGILSLNTSLDMFQRNNLTTTQAKAVYQIGLPKGLELENNQASDISIYKPGDEATFWPVQGFTPDLITSADTNYYTFELRNAERPSSVTFTMDLKLKNTCAVNENRSVKAEIRMFIYPTGSVGGNCYDVKYDGIQVYPSISLLCKEEGVTYGFDRERITVGYKDSDNDGNPDIPLVRVNSADIVHDILLAGDTARYKWDAKIVDAGNKALYAVLFSEVNESYLVADTLHKELTLDGNTSGIQAVLKNTRLTSGRLGCASPYDRGTGVSAKERYAFVWEITKTDGIAFVPDSRVLLAVNMLISSGTSSYNQKVWCYAAANPLSEGIGNTSAVFSPVLSPEAARKGQEEYSFFYQGIFPYIYINSVSYTFNGAVTVSNSSGIFRTEGYRTNPTYFPYEYRNLSTLDSAVITVPEGYELPDEIDFTIRNYKATSDALNINKTVKIAASTQHANSPVQKTFVFGAEIFDVNWDNPAKVPLPNGYYSVTASLPITATYTAPEGLSHGNIASYSDNHSYTQANVYNYGVKYTRDALDLTYIDPGSLKAIASGNPVQEALTSQIKWNIKLANTKAGSNANSAWLYVQGPVEDVSINIGSVDYPGSGEGNRWIELPAIVPGDVDAVLSVRYVGTDCNSQKVTLHPVFDREIIAQGAWNPVTHGGFSAMSDAGFLAAQISTTSRKYIYNKLELTIQNVASRISGSITSLASTPAAPSDPAGGNYGQSTVMTNTNFPVEIVFDARGASGSVVNARAEITVPEGLQYTASSARLQINGTNIDISATALATALAGLDGAAKTVSLKLSDAGIASGELHGDSCAYLRFFLMPNCNIATTSPRISARFFGDRPCGGSAANSGSGVQYSSRFTLTGMSSTLKVNMKKPVVTRSDFSCSDEAAITMEFMKDDAGATTSISLTDSLRIAIPKALDIKPGTDIAYFLPAGVNGQTKGGYGIVATGIDNRIEGNFRFITWPLPKLYFDSLAFYSEGIQTAYNIYTVQLQMTDQQDYFNDSLRVAVVTETNKGPGCNGISSEDYIKRAAAVTRAAHTTWTGGNSTSDWSNFDNWSDGAPGPCSDATIRTSVIYPELTDIISIDSIHFEANTEIGGVPYLNYSKATLDLQMLSNQWHLLAAPLRDMYSGDYILSGNRYNPAVYMRKYQSQDYWLGTEKKVAEWTTSFGKTNVPLSPGSGYAVWVATDGSSNIPQTFDFPKDSMSYVVYNLGGTEVIWMEDIPANGRNNNRKLIYDGIQNGSHEFDLPVENGSETAYTNLLIANPFMSHLDFQVFHTANSTKIQNKYYIWGGNSFKAIDDEVVVQNESQRYIAPQQSFVVLRNGNADVSTLHFTPTMSVANQGTTLKRATLERPARLQLKVYKYDKLQSEAEIRYKRGASNSFDESEDAWTLFSNSVKKAAVIYSKIENAAASINTLGNISEDIPLGIRTSEASELKFVIEGAETFDGEVYLVDAAQGREVNLTENPEYVFQNNTGDIPDRFYIRIRETATYIYKGTATPDIKIYQENGTVHITSASDDPLRSVEISNAQGQIIAKREGSSSNITIPIPLGNQVVVVKAVSERGQAVRKVKI